MERRPIRIANFSGFLGDRASGLAEVVAGARADVVAGDYLSEVTMLVLAKLRGRDPRRGYAAPFLAHIVPCLADLAVAGTRVVTNAGGLNPHGLAAELRTAIAAAGLGLRVAVVDGDDVTDRADELRRAGQLTHLQTGQPLLEWGHEVLTANAYLGAWGIVVALADGADIVVTGRTTDASLIVGPAAWWHGWSRDDHDALAGAVVAGHVIECGAQATGGNYSGFVHDSGSRPAQFPVAEIAVDGSSVISAVNGGHVTVGTATAQVMYEISGPAYFGPDVVAWFDTITIEPHGDDAVAITGARGDPPPVTTKVAITALGGFRNSFSVVVTGLDADRKRAWFESAVRDAVARIGGIDHVEFETIGAIAANPATQGDASFVLRCTATGREDSVGRPFGAAIVELALSNFPGFYMLGIPTVAQEFGTYWPGLIDQACVRHRVTAADGSVRAIPPPAAAPARRRDADDVARPAVTSGADADVGPTALVALGAVVDARSGDKGGDANIGLWVRDRTHWPWLQEWLTVGVFRELVPEAATCEVERFEFANLGALNFVVAGLLGDGATSSTRVDAQAKALGEYVRAKLVPIPLAMVDPELLD